ncbi:MAG: alanine racemase [Armatimonadetes bacterium]|nr:alanine racemase [Armatimonadota bacterium]
MKKTKETYEKPFIIRHNIGYMNKFGRSSAHIPLEKIDNILVKDLVKKYGSPLYVVSEGKLRRKYKEIERAFSLRYPKVKIAYSYKTNYLSAICALFHQEGAWAEVVSGFEYSIAESLKVQGEEIIFNGPYKTKEELIKALEAGAKVNIDSYDELALIEEIAKEKGKILPVGIRINMELTYPPWDRFGFNYESGQALSAFKRALSSGVLKIEGLHIHIGTYIADPEIYAQMAEKLIAFLSILQKEIDLNLNYLDIGGGYASINTLHAQWMSAEYTCPTFEQYAEAICPILLKGPYKLSNLPLLILEPGRSIVDEGMYLITQIVANKRLSNGARALILDAGVNLLPTAYWYRHDVLPAQDSGNIYEEANLYGPLCMIIDCLRINVSLPPLHQGDFLVIKNVGAYNFSQSMQFIRLRPAIIMIMQDGKTELIRAKEDFEYLKSLEKIPEKFLK